MMSPQIQVKCPQCSQPLRLKDLGRDIRVRCPSCSTLIKVKTPARPSSAQAKSAPEFEFESSQLQSLPAASYPASRGVERNQAKHSVPFAKKIALITGVTAMVALLAVTTFFIISYNLSDDEQIVSQAIIDSDGVAAQEIAWETVVVAQCRAKFPPENVRNFNTIVKDGVTSTMLIDFRLETDSQYSIIVMTGESGNVLLTPEQFAETLTVSLSNFRPVHRNGADGVAAKVETGDRMLPRGTEIEILKKGNVLVITHYQPYSATRNPERDELIPKFNERELDKPEEFFASITIL